MKFRNSKQSLSLLIVVLLAMLSGAILIGVSCADDPISAEDCGPRPYTWNEKAGNCRNGAGQVVPNRCCGR